MSESTTEPTTSPGTEASRLSLTTSPFASAAMRAVFDDRARLQRMLDFEAMLARAKASLGVASASAVDAIVQACRAERYDVAALVSAAGPAGNIARPLIDALIAEVGKVGADAARDVHRGASDQDVIDTTLVLELRDAIDVLCADIERAIAGFTALATKHRRLPMIARVGLQHTLPLTFGLKVAGYAAALARARARLTRLRKESLVLQFGGDAGTLAVLGEYGFQISQRLAALLDLPLPDAPWHSHRDRLADVASAFAILAGTCGKIARDVSLMMQTEVAEAFERAASGPDGTPPLPHQRHPVATSAALAAATMTPNLTATILAAQVQEHERGTRASEAEWQTFPMLALITSGALASVVTIAEGMEIDAERMRANLEATGGLVMGDQVAFALAGKIGSAEAQALVAEASRKAFAERRPLMSVLMADERVTAHLPAGELSKLFEPTAYQGTGQIFIERQVASLQSRPNKRS